MSTAAMSKDPILLPQQPGGNGTGFLLALLAHGLLIVALAFGVNWRASEPEGVQAELWAAVPQTAAPAPQEPPPEPAPKPQSRPAPPPPPQAKDTRPDAQIAVEQRREKERQLKQREAELKEKEKEKAKREKEQLAKQEEQKQKEQQLKQKEEAARIEALRKQQLQRILGQAGASSPDATPGNAARTAGPSATYAGRVIARIRPNIVLVDEVQGNPQADVEVHTSPDGTIISRTIVKPSGVAEWDDAVLRAIDRTQVLPRDVDGRVPPKMTITFKRN